MSAQVLRYAAFTTGGRGGNPAGVVLDAQDLAEPDFLEIARVVGYSETAFLTRQGDQWRIRYFSPRAEVDFCGHATVASAVALAERHGPGRLELVTNAGLVPVTTHERRDRDGFTATLESPATSTTRLDDALLDEALAALRWSREDLDLRFPVHVAFAGNHHLVLGVHSREVLDTLDYDDDRLASLMSDQGWTTTHLFWAAGDGVFHARNPFPPGGVREDPATGAAAAAFGGYLRDLALHPVPGHFTILQGHQMGSPSELHVELDGSPHVRVTGSATQIPG